MPRKGFKAQKASPKVLRQAERRVEALSLRKQGYSYEQIGQHLKITKQGAHQLVAKTLADTIEEPADDVRKLELARLDDLNVAVWEQAMGGDPLSIASALRILDARAKMLGLNAPVRSDVTSLGESIRSTVEVKVQALAELDRFLVGLATRLGSLGAA